MAEPLITVDPRNARSYTCAVIELVDEGMLDKSIMVKDLLMWMDESDVRSFCNRHLRDEDNECMILPEAEERDPMDDFNYVGSRDHY